MNEDGWFSDLYERNYALLYRIGRVFLGGGAREALIEDQIQEAFVRAWQKRDKLQNHPKPDGWMVECFRKCLMNACWKQARDWRRRAFPIEEENAPPVADAAQVSPVHYAATWEQLALLRRLPGDKDAHFSGAAIASVSCRFFGEGEGDPYFGENYYDFTYFDADNRMQFSCIVNGYTGKNPVSVRQSVGRGQRLTKKGRAHRV